MLPLIPHLMINQIVGWHHESQSSFSLLPFDPPSQYCTHTPWDYWILNFNLTKRGISSNPQHPVTRPDNCHSLPYRALPTIHKLKFAMTIFIPWSPLDHQINPKQGPKSWNGRTYDISATHTKYYKYINMPNKNGIFKLGTKLHSGKWAKWGNYI
jgi:hypothetical protein